MIRSERLFLNLERPLEKGLSLFLFPLCIVEQRQIIEARRRIRMFGAAYVVAGRVSADELLAWCEARLARFKVPKTIDLVAEIPRNGMGKVQKQELGRRELAR